MKEGRHEAVVVCNLGKQPLVMNNRLYDTRPRVWGEGCLEDDQLPIRASKEGLWSIVENEDQ